MAPTDTAATRRPPLGKHGPFTMMAEAGAYAAAKMERTGRPQYTVRTLTGTIYVDPKPPSRPQLTLLGTLTPGNMTAPSSAA